MKRLLLSCWLFILGGVFLTPLSVYAADSYRSEPGSFIKVTEYDAPGYGITNSGSYSYFIPTKTQAEFDAFRAAVPSLPDLSICDVVDGGWGECSAETHTRSCTNPEPSCGGAGCDGPSNCHTDGYGHTWISEAGLKSKEAALEACQHYYSDNPCQCGWCCTGANCRATYAASCPEAPGFSGHTCCNRAWMITKVNARDGYVWWYSTDGFCGIYVGAAGNCFNTCCQPFANWY